MPSKMIYYLRKPFDIGYNSALAFAFVGLIGIGWIMVISASSGFAMRIADSSLADIAIKQSIYFGAALLAFFIVVQIKLELIEKSSKWFIWVAYALLLMVFLPGVGVEFNGARRWIKMGFGGLTLQSSEVARLCVLVYLAGYMTRLGENVRNTFKGFGIPLTLIIAAAALLLAQPDFGAAAVLCATSLCLLFLAGARLRYFIFGVIVMVVTAAGLVFFKDYREQRLLFLDPWVDASGGGYQLIQSLMAFANGGITGVGLGGSTQKLNYLPEAHNDFVFAVLGEELGFVGVICVLLLYFVLIASVVLIAIKALKKLYYFGAFLSFGIGVWLCCQVLINIGVAMGLLPTKGLTLVFMSSGGSAIIVAAASIALVWRVNYEVNEIPENSNLQVATL